MVAMQYYHLYAGRGRPTSILPISLINLEVVDMPSMLNLVLLSFGLLAGTALAAQAQSVSSLPPGGSNPRSRRAPVILHPLVERRAFTRSRAGTRFWKEPNYHPPADYATNPGYTPIRPRSAPSPARILRARTCRIAPPPGTRSRLTIPMTRPGWARAPTNRGGRGPLVGLRRDPRFRNPSPLGRRVFSYWRRVFRRGVSAWRRRSPRSNTACLRPW